MKLEARMSKLESIVATHLEQSGGIQADLAWLKKAYWTLAGAGVTFNVTLAVGLILYLIKR